MTPDISLPLGKVDQKILHRSVMCNLPLYDKPMLDANLICRDVAITHNLAVGVPLFSLGFFAFHYVASNMTVRFARPTFLVTGIYLPPKSTESTLETIAKGLGDEANKYEVKVVAGHTGVYKGFNIPIVSVTCLGKIIRKPRELSTEDVVLIAGEIGKEAVWLKTLEDKNAQKALNLDWKLTPLPLALKLMTMNDVVLMHDVSEGGIAGALYEVGESTSFRLDIDSSTIPLHKKAADLGEDPLKIPSYGCLIIMATEESSKRIINVSRNLGYSCSVVGGLKKGRGVFVDGIKVSSIKRTKLDEIYGSTE